LPTTPRKKINTEAAAVWAPVESLTPWANNPRKNDGRPVEAVADSIRRFGFASPLLVRLANGEIIAGHTRLKAAKLLGLETVPVRYLDLTEEEAHLLALADNKIAELADWERDILGGILAQLDADDLAVAGFDDDDLANILGDDEPLGPEDVEPEAPPEDPDSKFGEVYQLGPHRLICGDSTNPELIETLRSVDVVLSDPPYGTGIIASAGLGNSTVPMDLIGDENPDLAKKSFKAWSIVQALQVWWGANYYADALPGSPCWIVWDKDHHGMTFADAELAYVNRRSPTRVFRHAWSGNHRASERSTEKQHPTQKPVALYEWTLKTFAPESETVADPFGGSGSSLLACARTGRTATLIELDPGYCDVIRKRWTAWAKEAGQDPGPGALE
tara:strand:+ start:128 stop:1291 length:1164 start_codon:yes stop_codon:yes gene_type:complete